jgi:hypothetical protein
MHFHKRKNPEVQITISRDWARGASLVIKKLKSVIGNTHGEPAVKLSAND